MVVGGRLLGPTPFAEFDRRPLETHLHDIADECKGSFAFVGPASSCDLYKTFSRDDEKSYDKSKVERALVRHRDLPLDQSPPESDDITKFYNSCGIVTRYGSRGSRPTISHENRSSPWSAPRISDFGLPRISAKRSTTAASRVYETATHVACLEA